MMTFSTFSMEYPKKFKVSPNNTFMMNRKNKTWNKIRNSKASKRHLGIKEKSRNLTLFRWRLMMQDKWMRLRTLQAGKLSMRRMRCSMMLRLRRDLFWMRKFKEFLGISNKERNSSKMEEKNSCRPKRSKLLKLSLKLNQKGSHLLLKAETKIFRSKNQ